MAIFEDDEDYAAFEQVLGEAVERTQTRLVAYRVLPNHGPVLLGPDVTPSPADVAISLLNNLAYMQGRKPAFRFSYYVGTVGLYDRNAVRRL